MNLNIMKLNFYTTFSGYGGIYYTWNGQCPLDANYYPTTYPSYKHLFQIWNTSLLGSSLPIFLALFLYLHLWNAIFWRFRDSSVWRRYGHCLYSIFAKYFHFYIYNHPFKCSIHWFFSSLYYLFPHSPFYIVLPSALAHLQIISLNKRFYWKLCTLFFKCTVFIVLTLGFISSSQYYGMLVCVCRLHLLFSSQHYLHTVKRFSIPSSILTIVQIIFSCLNSLTFLRHWLPIEQMLPKHHHSLVSFT